MVQPVDAVADQVGTMAYEVFHSQAAPAVGGAAAVQAALLKEISKQLVGTVGGDPMAVGQVVQAKVATGPDGKPTLMLGNAKVPAQLPEGVVSGQVLRLQVKESSPERVVLQIVKGPDGAPVVTGPPTAGNLPGAPGAPGAAAAGGARTLPQLAASATQGAGAGAGASATGSISQAAATAATAPTSDLSPAQQAAQAPAVAQQAAASVVPWAVIPMPGGAQARVWLDPDGSGDGDETGTAAPRRRTMVIRYDSPVLGRTDVVLHLDQAQLDAHVLAPAGQSLDLIRGSVPDLRLALAGAVDRPVAVVTGGRAGEDIDLRV